MLTRLLTTTSNNLFTYRKSITVALLALAVYRSTHLLTQLAPLAQPQQSLMSSAAPMSTNSAAHTSGASNASDDVRADVDAILQFCFAGAPKYAADTYASEAAKSACMKKWWSGDAEVDTQCREFAAPYFDKIRGNHQYIGQVQQVGEGGYLAVIILCDQLSRNVFRGSNGAFDYEQYALNATLKLIEQGADAKYSECYRTFMYMPLMHSESREHAKLSVQKFDAIHGKRHDFAHNHADVIEKFGRYPSRNAALGRESTPEELEHLRTTTNGWEKSQAKQTN